MAEITVAKALTRLKIIQRRLEDLIQEVVQAAPTHSKACSLIVAEKDLTRNHKEAKAVLRSRMQAITDLQKYYVVVNTAILKSNLETKITSDLWGEMTVAQALTYAASLKPHFKNLDEGMRRAAVAAQQVADGYNRMTFSNNAVNNEDFKAVMAQPVLLIEQEDITRIKNDYEVVVTELNDLINQSNAITVIQVPDDIPGF